VKQVTDFRHTLPYFRHTPPYFRHTLKNTRAHLLTRGIPIVPTGSIQRCMPCHLHSMGKESKREVSEGREGGVRGEGGDGQGEHLVACTIVAGCTSADSTAAGRRHETPPDTSNVSRHTHACESDTHHLLWLHVFFLPSNPILSRALAKLTFGPASGGAVHCLLLYAVRRHNLRATE
jgi:hypothetical protein